ncbi:indole-3-acetate beta-glucosyltransferase-like [Oryza glaberrima]|uniref:indole-3-acetate beta-glucosyltransferase-like n=1 Tax=Oryza glaberrima TaxID=4538 RepID=UPI00224C2F30|nr:indole-3-acetate beta-glucosyltransferase-like [Oryza glaberrima]
MAHVLVVPYPSQGHMNPMVQFARKLASKGVAVTVVTTRFIERTTSSSAGGRGLDACPGVRVEAISDGHDEGGVASAASLEEYLATLDAAGAASLAGLVAAEARGAGADRLPFTCVVYDTFAPWAGRVARGLGLPAVAFSTQSCAVSAVYHYVHEGKLAVPAPEQEPATSRSAAFAGLPEMERRELPSFVLGDGPYPTLAVFALSQFADSGKDDWVLFNSFDELESEVLAGLSTQWKARAIGPCVPLPAGDGATGRFTYGANLFDPEDTCMQWLDTKPPSSVAYVSFGSFASLGAAQTEELARGLLAAGRPFLWVVRATEEAQLPRHLLDAATASGDALVVRWSPQLDVLAHRATGCFVTHCGWNSTLEALGFGVPMVALPLWTDQPTNALLVERAWGAGVRASRGDADADDAAGGTAAMFLRGEIERCVRAVMDGEEQEAARARARGEARRWSDAARAAVSPGGSSDRSLDEFVEFLRGGSGAGAGEKWKALVREGSEAAASEM